MADTGLLGLAGKVALKNCAVSARNVCGLSFLYVLLGSIALIAALRADESKLRSSQPMKFEIPAQSLAQALDGFSIATGIDVFYNAAIAERRQSNSIVGSFTPQNAIQIILAGSGYVARVTAPGSLAIVKEDAGEAPQAGSARGARYEAYFAEIQAKVGQVLCTWPDTSAAGADMLLRLWLKPSGDVARAELLGHEGGDKLGVNRSVAGLISQTRFVAPPADMPQPITLVVLPLSSQVDRSCADSRGVTPGRAVER